jgi:cytochrome b561
MRIKNSAAHYGLVSKLFHWVIALSIGGLIWLGWYMVDLTYFDKWYNQSLALHKAFGVLVLGVAFASFGWKVYSRSPAPAAINVAWQRVAANAMHTALMMLMVLIPVSGYLISTSAGKPVSLFGVVGIPALFEKDDDLRDLAVSAHFYLAYGIGFLIIGHAGAAIKHQFIDRDGTLGRMIWR